MEPRPECDLAPLVLSGLDSQGTWRAGDVDGDGRADLVSWRLGPSGSGLFRHVFLFHLSSEGDPWGPERYHSESTPNGGGASFSVGNFNGDERAELMVLGERLALVVSDLVGEPEVEGNGYPSVEYPNVVGQVDFDRDGYMDVVRPAEYHNPRTVSVRTARASGTGTYALTATREAAPDGWGFSHFIADATGAPWFWLHVQPVCDPECTSAASGALFFVDSAGIPNAVASAEDLEVGLVADFDGDGIPEILAYAGTARSEILRSEAGAFESVEVIDVGGHKVAADVDGDRFTDLLAIGGSSVTVFRGSEEGLLEAEHTDGPADARVVGTADADGDAIADLLLAHRAPQTPSRFEVTALQFAPMPNSCADEGS